ncbi:transglutaminase domain-containing protein [Flavihumibacter rivuli]|uniref:transglutaminase-like domain-containing protein n=1 Tax=Flavihumibacter rivuli TaxID=2838156 RepID=UPI001BDF6D3E|nr:transglutaminase domain-containing protein [Flavihumibacter rivuli]ULQ55167.1 transglutaminase domain-containing protein [Flavihumibacter rivuli]
MKNFSLNLIKPILLVCLLYWSSSIIANDSKNISISRQTDNYDFELANGKVVVRNKTSTSYRCNAYRTEIPIVEFYSDQNKIEDVRIFVNGDRSWTIEPSYDYYSIDNVFYSDARICHFTLPLQKQGTESKVDFNKVILDPRYFTSIQFPEPYDIVEKQVRVSIPRWMKAELKELNFNGYSITRKTEYDSQNDADIITYTIRNMEGYEKESMSPGFSHLFPHLLVLCKQANTTTGQETYFNTLQDQYNWYRSLVKQVDSDKAILKNKGAEITNGLTKEEDKIRAIYNWVQENIRYIAFEDGIAGFKPDKANEVLRKKYGDCKGMANLTKELLAATGFDARLCWIGTNHIAYDYSTPNLAVDNHMICAVKHNGKFVFLDATETYIGLEQYAERIQGRQVLIENGDQYILERIPVMTYAQNTEWEKRILKIEGEDIAGAVEQTWNGESKEYLLSSAHSIKKEKLEEAFVSFLSEGKHKFKITSFSLPDIQNSQKQLTIKYQIWQPGAAQKFGDEYYIDIDSKKELSDFIIDTAKRKYPIEFPYKQHIRQEIRLQVPDGFKVQALPQALSVDREQYGYKLSYAMEGKELVYRKEILFKQARLNRPAFTQWNEDNKKLSNYYLEQITLVKQ